MSDNLTNMIETFSLLNISGKHFIIVKDEYDDFGWVSKSFNKGFYTLK